MSRSEHDLFWQLYFGMLRIRMAEEKICELFTAGHIVAPVHLSIGQEAAAVGVMSALTHRDSVVSTHRCHGHYLAKGGDLKAMFAELCGRSTGCAGGYGGTMHLTDDDAGFAVAAPIVGASIPFAVGLALAFKMRGEDRIAVAFFGDGAIEEGVFWESINFAAVHRLPVLFVCENNIYATHSPIWKRQPAQTVVERVKPHGLETFLIRDGNDVLEIRAAALEATEDTRKGQPVFVEIPTYRFKEHWGVGDDSHLGYRSREEIDAHIANDPLHVHQHRIPNVETMEQEIRAEIDEAVAWAMESPEPRPLKGEST